MQVLSDLHLEFADGFRPLPAEGAELLVVAGDIGHSPEALLQLAGWPVPVLYVPGNHEYDGADIDEADDELREMAGRAGITLLNLDEHRVGGVRFLGCSRWWDFDLLGSERRAECMRAASRYLRHMSSFRWGRPLGPEEVRELALEHRAWLEARLAEPFEGPTVVVSHSGPSARSADPRYGLAPGTGAFCNADDDLIPRADVWLHGHLHCRHDYRVPRPGRAPTRVVSHARGLVRKREADGHDATGALALDG